MILLRLVLLISFISLSLGQTTIYVSVNGTDDTGCGQTPSSSCASVEQGVSVACASGGNETIVLVQPGNYTESSININCSVSIQLVFIYLI